MTADELRAKFEDCSLDPGEFHHRQHVEVAWSYLREFGLHETLARFSAGLRRFATAAGQSGLYHETITWAFVILIHERMTRDPASRIDWLHFAEANDDLLVWSPSVLARYYQPETLRSDLARECFLLPDRA